MNIQALKGYIEEAIKFEYMHRDIEYMHMDTQKNRINNHTNGTFIIDHEELFRTQGKIQAFKEILQVINKSTKKEGE